MGAAAAVGTIGTIATAGEHTTHALLTVLFWSLQSMLLSWQSQCPVSYANLSRASNRDHSVGQTS